MAHIYQSPRKRHTSRVITSTMASICPTTFRLSKQGEIRRFRKIYAKLVVEPKLERMPEVDQIKIAEAIYRGKLRLYDNGMLDATPRTSDVIAT